MSASSPRFSLDRQFIEQSERTPDRVALICDGRTMRYGELADRSARIAAALRARGIGRGAVVGLHLERSIEWVAATIGILRSGAAVMPLPPSYPVARLRDIIEQAGLRAVIESKATPIDKALEQDSLDFDALCADVDAAVPLARSPADEDGDRPAFVLCSSGSTGVPKMIVRSHRSFQHRLAWTWAQHPFVADDVGCHKAHTTTTHGVYELFEPLLRGSPTVIATNAQVRDLEQFWALLRTHAVTRLLIVPSAMQASLGLPGFEPPPFKVVVLMGEPLAARLARRIVDAFPQSTQLYSIYGSTEASSTIVCNLREATESGDDLPLGRPIAADIGVHVLDSALEPVVPGQVGRLYISGPALFDHYLGQAELTTQVVIRHPRSGELLYDTRDDVRCRPDGNIVFVGRADDTVKIRGFRVELAEVERAINACPGVTQGAAVVVGEDLGDAALVGFFTPRSVPVHEVFNSLRNRLPPYMVPARLIALDALPLTERSKLDRRRLVTECLTGQQDSPPDSTLSPLEQRVAAVWERVLGHRRFSRDSSFFEVGGTSLTAAVLMHQLRTEFGVARDKLPEQFAYRFSTIAAMAARLARPLDTAVDDTDRTAPYLVTLRRATAAAKPPLFCIASAGGTLGAYRKVVAALRYEGEIVGVRDPYVTGDRDPTESFDRWVEHYLDAIRSRHPSGPYCIAAYSSAGAFGVELARRLTLSGAVVRALVLIDPLAIERGSWRRYGWWVMLSTHARPWLRTLTRLVGALRRPTGYLLRMLRKSRGKQGFALSSQEFDRLSREMVASRGHLLMLAALMELNTGLPLDLSDVDIPPEPPTSTLHALQARLSEVMPELDGATIERIAIQYALQVLAQRAYVAAPYDGPTLLVEPASPYAGLLAAQLRPIFSRLRVARFPLGPADPRISAISRRFGPWVAHYRSMRDDRFAESLARELDKVLS
jgi:enterobactin synthetase component F